MTLENLYARKYLALITFTNGQKTWIWLDSTFFDNAHDEVKQLFLNAKNIPENLNEAEIDRIQFVCAKEWSVWHFDKEHVSFSKDVKNCIMTYCYGHRKEEKVSHAFIPVRDLVQLENKDNYGIMAGEDFEIFFDENNNLCASFAGTNHFTDVYYTINQEWWLEEANKKLREIQENRGQIPGTLLSPDKERICRIQWKEKE